MSSCTKKHTAEVDNETQSVADYSLIQNEFLSLMAAVFTHANHTALIGDNVQCDSLRLISGDRNFGSAGHIQPVFALDLDKPCTVSGWDTKTRNGSVRIRVTAPLSQTGAFITVLLSGYNVNGTNFTCDSLLLRTTADTDDSTTFDVAVLNANAFNDDFKIRYTNNGKMICYPAESPAALKNQVRFTGSGNGVNRQETAFTMRTLTGTPEQKVRTCKYISSGYTEVIPSGFKARLVNYGDGTCNDDASFDVNNNTIAIKLK